MDLPHHSGPMQLRFSPVSSLLWSFGLDLNEAEAQEFIDCAVAKMWYGIWCRVYGPVPGWTESLTIEMVFSLHCPIDACKC